MSEKKTPIVTRDNLEQVIDELLDISFWPPGIKTDETYKVQTDDTDGDPNKGWLTVYFTCDSDAHVSQSARTGLPDEVRFRSSFGGGKHQRVRNAICILAMAMKKDMEGEGNEPYRPFEDDEEE